MNPELPEFHYCPLCGAPVELQLREGRSRPVCISCGYIIYINPIPAVALIVMNARNVLLTLRDVEPQKGEWCLPGGFLEWGESPEEGGTRELFEETGITAEQFSPVGIYESRSGNRQHVLILVYHVTQWKGEPLPGDDASEVRWFNITDVPELAFSAHEQALAHVIRGMNQ